MKVNVREVVLRIVKFVWNKTLLCEYISEEESNYEY